MLRLRRATQTTRRDPVSLTPISATVLLEDTRGRSYAITGNTLAPVPWSDWPNMSAHVGLARWELAGEIGWGDLQEFQSPDYVRAMSANAPA